MYDISTLAVIAQQSNTNAPFAFTGVINTVQNVGGSVFASTAVSGCSPRARTA